MPHVENAPLPKDLAHYADYFIAPKNKQPDVKNLLEVCRRYQIVDHAVPFENLVENYIEYTYPTDKEGLWRVKIMGLPLRSYRYVNGNIPQMRNIEQSLAQSQSFKLPAESQKSEFDHAKGMYFIASNIEVVDEILTNTKKHEKYSRNPLWFIETPLPHPKKERKFRTDLIYIGSDNRFRILEFGNSCGKPGKVEEYARGLQSLYRQVNKVNLSPQRILPFVVRYSISDDANELSIYPSELLRKKIEDY